MKVNESVRRSVHPARAGWLWLGIVLMLLTLAGCASGPHANPNDPFEPMNRRIYQFNDAVDSAVFRPVAGAYRDIAPVRVRQGVGNFFGNLEDVWSFVNNVLQLKGQGAMDSLRRVGVNTFLGWGGIFDVATEMDIEKHTKDFGHTLGYWGVGSGPYLVLPLLGPSTLRDAVALPVDWQGDLVTNVPHVPTRNTATVLRLVDTRAALLKASSMLEEASLDVYTFTRDAFLQRRRSVIYDGNPPEEDLEDVSALPPEPPALPVDALSDTSHAGISGEEKVKP